MSLRERTRPRLGIMSFGSEGPGQEAPSDRGPGRAEGFGEPQFGPTRGAIKPAISGLTAAAKRRFLGDCRRTCRRPEKDTRRGKAC